MGCVGFGGGLSGVCGRCPASGFPPAPTAEPPPPFRCICTDLRRPLEHHRSSLPPPFPQRPHLPAGHGLKSSAAPIAPRRCTGLRRVASPNGNLMEEGMGVLTGGSMRILGLLFIRPGPSTASSLLPSPDFPPRRPPCRHRIERGTMYRFPPERRPLERHRSTALNTRLSPRGETRSTSTTVLACF